MVKALLAAAASLMGLAYAQSVLDSVPTDELIGRLKANPADMALVVELATRGGPQTIPVLKESFLLARQTGTVTNVGVYWSQMIATFLIRLGAPDRIYFDELAKYVRLAIDANPPVAGSDLDRARDPSAEFLAWCARNNLHGDACMLAVTHYAMDITMLGASEDQRAIPILREVLGLSNPVLVDAAVLRLGIFGDSASLPMIAAACGRFPANDANVIGSAAATFESPAMRLALDKCVSDSSLKEALIKEWQDKRGKTKDDQH